MSHDDQIAQFRTKFGYRNSSRMRDVSFIAEELSELAEACADNDVVEQLDALADIVYFCYGVAFAMGYQLDPVIDEVHRSNMTKSPLPSDHKGMFKGPDFRPPRIGDLLCKIRRPSRP